MHQGFGSHLPCSTQAHGWGQGGTDAGAGLGGPRSLLVSLTLPQAAKLALGKDPPGRQEDAVVVDKGPGWLAGADLFRPWSCNFHVPFIACFYQLLLHCSDVSVGPKFPFDPIIVDIWAEFHHFSEQGSLFQLHPPCQIKKRQQSCDVPPAPLRVH